ncbi:uncharacterized protein zgc:174906 [Silurus meridionalis]|uniref:Uncharacterized protein n=1 Tax=Silurus meridionalis TaxID=175797 RepID=A0A8T0AVZ1_SILME|nr:uncharacterized protein zgc:174906 [Silurus meridionalis]KAF7696206.1 hypothetical protein HF521_006300 [Silurus meridionalis]KAI5096045.1 hypothetical protein C0J45_14475 [Silurus meridionalis]
MDMELKVEARLIQKFKPQLIDALSGDPDFLLQHCHASQLLTQKEYSHVKASVVPWDKTRDILDYVMNKDRKRLQIFLKLLKKKEIKEAFPKLAFLDEVEWAKSLTIGNKRNQNNQEKQAADDVPRKQMCKFDRGNRMVTEKQLMLVARNIGITWKEVGRVALEIPSVRLEQIVEENPHSHREKVFCMLRLWSMREKEKASAVRLHSLLTQEDFGVSPGSIDFLLEESSSPPS